MDEGKRGNPALCVCVVHNTFDLICYDHLTLRATKQTLKIIYAQIICAQMHSVS